VIAGVCGVNRVTLFNDGWHERYPHAVKLLFGFKAWDETKVHVALGMPELKDCLRSSISCYNPSILKVKFTDFTAFERCLITKMFMRCHGLKKERLGLVFGQKFKSGSVGKYVKEWASC
jgi:hypothetical protein